MVLVIKYPKSMIDDAIFEYMEKIFMSITERYYLNFQAIGSDRDHLHILVEAAPRYSPSRVMQICKSITAREIFKRFPEVKKELWGGHFWSEGGHLDTIGDGYDVQAMEDYIKEQGVSKSQTTNFQFESNCRLEKSRNAP